MPELSKEQKLLLVKPLPPEAITDHPTKRGMSSIKPIFIVERLNEVFGTGVWRLETELIPLNGAGEVIMVIDKVTSTNKDRREYSCVVKTKLIIDSYKIYYESIAGSTNDDMGDAAKGGTSDGLSKICSWMGIGMDVYKGAQAQSQARWLARIKPVIKGAIADLSKCKSVDELKALRAELAHFVLEDSEFIAAATNRFNEVNAEAQKPTLNEAGTQKTLPEAKEPEVAQSQTQEPAIAAIVVPPIKPGSLGTEIKDAVGNLAPVAKYLDEADTVDKMNATRTWLLKKQDEGYDIKEWLNALHEKAITKLNLIFLDKEKRFSIFNATVDSKGVNVFDAEGNLIDLGAKVASANTIPVINALLAEIQGYLSEGYQVTSWGKTLHERATNTLGFRYNSNQRIYYVDVTKMPTIASAGATAATA